MTGEPPAAAWAGALLGHAPRFGSAAAASSATIRTEQSDGVTKFHVHRRGLATTRTIDELDIATMVA